MHEKNVELIYSIQKHQFHASERCRPADDLIDVMIRKTQKHAVDGTVVVYISHRIMKKNSNNNIYVLTERPWSFGFHFSHMDGRRTGIVGEYRSLRYLAGTVQKMWMFFQTRPGNKKPL